MVKNIVLKNLVLKKFFFNYGKKILVLNNSKKSALKNVSKIVLKILVLKKFYQIVLKILVLKNMC